ncbi:TetR/AcrR family transcriptional regulator [Chitinophagaceae bacterium MMS25-I14]
MSKAEQTKAFIVEKTAPIFNKKGYAGTSLSDITEATGLTKGSIYGNFTNKDEVALAAFDHNIEKVQHIIRAEMEQRTSAREKLMTYVHVYDHYMLYPFPQGGCPILNTAIEADDTHPVLRKKVLSVITTWKNKIINLIKTGIENGEFSAGHDPEQVALTIIATIEGSIMISKITGKPEHKKLVMQSVEKIIQGL